MKTNPSSSFIVEIPLQTSSKEEMILRKRFWAAKQQYNALLGEILKRLCRMRNDPAYQEALKQYKEKDKRSQAKITFKELAKKHKFREYDLYAFCKQWNKKKSPLRIGSRISQKLAKRVFDAVQKHANKLRGKPRFKGKREVSSIEDNSIDANLRLKEDSLHYLGISMPLLWNLKDPIHCHGKLSKHKYIRLVKRKFGQKTRYFAQIICEGKPWQKSKNQIQKGVVGLDLGPQTIAIVSPQHTKATLQVFADRLVSKEKKRKKLQRRLARQLRSNNPAAFEKDSWIKKDKNWKKKSGKNKTGVRLVSSSKKLKTTLTKLQDCQRREAAFRKTQHGKLANQILRQGIHIKTEKLSYKSFQKNFGKSVGFRAPGMFLEILSRKAENAGGKVALFSTYQTALSQTCQCGRKEKKKLAQRWHRCDCGVEAQRDLYSAYLASFVENDTLMADQAQKAWPGMDSALRTAMSELKQASSGPTPASLGLPGAEFVVRTVS